MPPPDPQRNSLGFDEFIGILIAFSTIGAILFWTLSRRHEDLNFSFVPVLPIPTTQPTPTPPVAKSPAPTLPAETSPAPTLLTPTVTSSESPEVVVPVVPSATPTQRPTQPVARVVPVPVPPPAPVVVAARPINFVDVPQDFWARPFIDALSARGIVSGFTGNYFRPDQPVTRAEFATILQAAFDNNPGQRVSEFKDVPTDFWAVPAIERATGDQFLKGYPGNVFRPAQQIPRVQVLVALVGGLKLPPPSNAGILQTYQDAAQIPNYATDKVAAATQAKLVVNYPNQNLLRPNQNATRAEVAAIVYQALVQAGKVKPIQSQYIVPPPQ